MAIKETTCRSTTIDRAFDELPRNQLTAVASVKLGAVGAERPVAIGELGDRAIPVKRGSNGYDRA